MADLTVIEVPVGTLERLVSAIEALERRMQGAVKQPEAYFTTAGRAHGETVSESIEAGSTRTTIGAISPG